MSVLVLCDDLMFTSKVTATGRAVGVTVAVARTPGTAIPRAAALPATCVLVDLHNPGLDVPVLLSGLRAVCPAMPRVIGFGSHVDADTLKAARKAGCDLVLPRSQFSEQLETKLTEWANGPRRPAMTADEQVRLRPLELGDLPRLSELQRDPESNRMVGMIPRTAEEFDSHWAKVLANPTVTARAVLLGEAFVGCISCFAMDGRDHVGYWIDRARWGRGIASRALRLLLEEVTKRPLYATAATNNGASLRVLEKCGFVVAEVRLSPATERFLERETAELVLG